MHAALCKVAEVPRDQLDEQVRLWAGEVRELSFDMEDVVGKFLVRAEWIEYALYCDGTAPSVAVQEGRPTWWCTTPYMYGICIRKKIQL